MIKAFACYNLNEEERSGSSSGGIYPLAAGEILKKGGVVYAACYDSQLDVVHRRIEDINGIKSSQGSKYVASLLSDTFRDIARDIQNGRKVLFVGTPCQCAGLHSFLRQKGIERSSVILVDFICHGVPGKKAWEAYKESLSKKGQKLTAVNMRDKTTGWSHSEYAWRFTTEDGRETVVPRRQVPYMKGMLANLFLRPSCFECMFKGTERCTDITLGDYWGVWDLLPEMDDNKGTSLVLIHTANGSVLFDEIRDRIKCMETDPQKAGERNACLSLPTSYNPKRKAFFARLNQGEDFIDLVGDLAKDSLIRRIKQAIKKSLKI